MKLGSMLLIALGLGIADPASAGLSLTLAPSDQVAAPGAELTFSGTLVNTSNTDKLFLNDLSSSASGPLALKSNAYFANVPGILLPNESYTGPIFRIKLSVGATTADYPTSITLQGGSTIDELTNLSTANLTLLATPVSQWRYTTFGEQANDALAADDADWDNDGDHNLIEYALGTDAKEAASKLQLPSSILDNHLQLSFSPIATDVTYAVESSTDLLHWATNDVELVTSSLPGVVTYRFTQPISALRLGFLRLRVNR